MLVYTYSLFWKLHENERIGTKRRACVPSTPSLDQTLQVHFQKPFFFVMMNDDASLITVRHFWKKKNFKCQKTFFLVMNTFLALVK